MILADRWEELTNAKGGRWWRHTLDHHTQAVRQCVNEMKQARKWACLQHVAPRGAEVTKCGNFKMRKLMKEYRATVAADMFPATVEVSWGGCCLCCLLWAACRIAL